MKRGLLLIGLLALLVGCGRKTPPVPPNAVIPEAITNLRYTADDMGVHLSWSYPSRSVEGKSIKNIRVFQLHKAVISQADYCDGCPVVYDQVIPIEARGIRPKAGVDYIDTDLQAGYHYVYMVQSGSGWRIDSAPSNRVEYAHLATLRSPREVGVEVGDHVLTVTWQPVSRRDDGSGTAGVKYQVYRGSSRTGLRPHGGLVEEPLFVDRGVSNEQMYYYNVRAVTVAEGFSTQGHASATVSGMALDMVPPMPPQNVQLVGLQQGLQLHWTPASDSDLGGYRIYRQRQGESEWQRIGSAPKGAIGFKDVSVLEPGLYYFVVTSFDIGLRHNESEQSVKVRYTAP